MVITPIRTAFFKRGNLASFIIRFIPRVKEGSVIAISSKIVALAEGQTAPVSKKETCIRALSTRAIQTKHTWLTEKDGIIMASAGIDESNADGKLVLLPKDSFKSAAQIRSQILKNFGMKKLGIIITDSRLYPLRAGVTGVALGYAGFKGLRDYRGKRDLFGRKLAVTQTNIADCLATAAVLVMGEGAERQPLCVIEDAPVEFTTRINRQELRMSETDDMFEPLLWHFRKR